MFSREDSCAHHGYCVQLIRERHQRRMQQRRHALDYFEADKRGEQKHISARKQVHFHCQAVSFCCPTRGGSEKNSRTRGLTTSPPRVSSVLLIMSSSILSCSFPSFTSS